MNYAPALTGLDCADCGETVTPTDGPGRCPSCRGLLTPAYDLEAVEEDLDPGEVDGTEDFLARTGLEALMPVEADASVDIGQGETPLVDAPAIAEDIGIGDLAVVDEGCNPTGTIADREFSTAVAVARAQGATDVALPTMGNGGQAAAAAAARAGIDSHSFVPTRTPFVNKAMINVHGGDMTVVEGRYPDAEGAFRDAMADADWYSLAPGDTPYRAEGIKPLGYEIAAANGWAAPDWVVVPTGQVTGLVGIHRGFQELVALDVIDDAPRLVAAQAAGCAPIVTAHRDGADEPVAVEHPDSVCGQLEIPDPGAGSLALAALRESDGKAVAASDDEIMAGAVTLAEAGLPGGVTAGAGIRATAVLADRGEIGADESVVLVNPVSANKEADLMRSHLMSKGI